MRRLGENEGDLRLDELLALPTEEQSRYTMMVFDEDFARGGLEDCSLFIRLRDTFGLKIVMSGFSCFYHLEGATRWSDDAGKGFGAESKQIETENERKFAEKWGFYYRSRSVWREQQIG